MERRWTLAWNSGSGQPSSDAWADSFGGGSVVHLEGGIGLSGGSVDASAATSDVTVGVQGDVLGGLRGKFIHEGIALYCSGMILLPGGKSIKPSIGSNGTRPAVKRID